MVDQNIHWAVLVQNEPKPLVSLITCSASQSGWRSLLLEQETHKKIVNAVNQEFAQLSKWLRDMGVSEADAFNLFSQVVNENGILGSILINSASGVLSVNPETKLQAAEVGRAPEAVKSGEFSARLLSQPEPTPEELDSLLSIIKNVVANVRLHLLKSAKLGPRRRGGGRHKELSDPEKRTEIREEIKGLRNRGVKLKNIFQQLGAKHGGVSSTTIKRIWLERTD